MSPIIARLAAANRLAASRAITSRPFSVIMKLRSIGRAMEHSPYERLPTTQASAKADWAKEIKFVTGKLLMFIPTFGLLLGWPVIAREIMDGHM
ncbi:hypothetical protein PT974_05715 [Cladobotryum mycophilum]|uniref:Uncharacterized protein n=1 Tax=Cladobotryum mycophilum TaxID=491253 RepID=A0ABR0SJU5_9HYPO